MREAAFVSRNKEKWIRFEKMLNQTPIPSPLVLGDLYVDVTDDLSFASTFYPNSQTHLYLNGLSGRAHQLIYSRTKKSSPGIYTFFLKDFPKLFFRYLPQLGVSLLTFLFFGFIGIYSSATDSSFVRAIMGDAYVNMTLENIAKGDPMAVYKQMEQFDMFLGITLNNIRVAVLAFLLGIIFGIGTLVVLMKNSIMLGAFQYFFYDHGLLWESARTIWIHGVIEIWVIIVAGAAGLVLGNSILFPGTYSRLKSFQMGTKHGLLIMLSTVPFFVLAGFLEGFVTRITTMPDWLSILIILSSFALVIYYYVLYPIHLNHPLNYGKLHSIPAKKGARRNPL